MLPDSIARLLPSTCLLCGMQAGNACICRRCTGILPWNRRCCPRCGQAAAVEPAAGLACADCQRSPPRFCRARAPLRYAFPIDAVLKQLKFSRRTSYVPWLGELLAPILAAEFADADLLVPVPLHRRRHFLRGFNQASELCRPLAAASGLPVWQRVRRVRPTRPQPGLSAAARRANLAGAFAVRGRMSCRFPVIVDDVMTTGTTADQLAAALLAAGADRVGVLAVARAVAPVSRSR